MHVCILCLGHWGPERDNDLSRVTQQKTAEQTGAQALVSVTVHLPCTEQGSSQARWEHVLITEGTAPSRGPFLHHEEQSQLHREGQQARGRSMEDPPSSWEQGEAVLKALAWKSSENRPPQGPFCGRPRQRRP